MDQTADIRENLEEAAQQVDAYIEEQIEHALLSFTRWPPFWTSLRGIAIAL
jgi:hypothetical protein